MERDRIVNLSKNKNRHDEVISGSSVTAMGSNALDINRRTCEREQFRRRPGRNFKREIMQKRPITPSSVTAREKLNCNA